MKLRPDFGTHMLVIAMRVFIVVTALNLWKDGWNTGLVGALIVIAFDIE